MRIFVQILHLLEDFFCVLVFRRLVSTSRFNERSSESNVQVIEILHSHRVLEESAEICRKFVKHGAKVTWCEGK